MAPIISHRAVRASLIAAGFLALSGCADIAGFLGGSPADTAAPAARQQVGIAGRTAWQGTQAATDQGQQTVVRTEADWQALWRLVGQPPPGPLPADWMAVAIFAGSTASPGGHIEILPPVTRRQVGQPERQIVAYRLPGIGGPPPENSGKAAASPWAVMLFRSSPLPVVFQEIE